MTRNTKFTAIGITVASLAIGLAGCAGHGKATKEKTSQEISGITPMLTGKVAETMDAGGYTYILLDKDGKKTWAAIPVTKVTVGQEVKLLGGAEMPGFTSKALNRTFDMILFSGGLYTGEKPAGAQADAKKKTADIVPGKAVLAGKVVETMQAASYTYLLIEKDGKRGWAAVPNTEVKVGEEIELIPGVDMGTFKSTTLKRTFDNIHFSTGVKGAREKQAALAASAPKASAAAVAGAPAAAGAPAGDLMPPGHPKVDGAAAAATPAPVATAAQVTGKVVETIEGGGYTYICLEKEKKKTWVAVPSTKVTVGQELSLDPGNVMHNFTSKTLNRTFESIIFTNAPHTN